MIELHATLSENSSIPTDSIRPDLIELSALTLRADGTPQWALDLKDLKALILNGEFSGSFEVNDIRKSHCVNIATSGECCEKMFLNLVSLLIKTSSDEMTDIQVHVHSRWGTLNNPSSWTGFYDWGKRHRWRPDRSSFAAFACYLEFQWPKWEAFQQSEYYEGREIDFSEPFGIPFKFELRCELPLVAKELENDWTGELKREWMQVGCKAGHAKERPSTAAAVYRQQHYRQKGAMTQVRNPQSYSCVQHVNEELRH